MKRKRIEKVVQERMGREGWLRVAGEAGNSRGYSIIRYWISTMSLKVRCERREIICKEEGNCKSKWSNFLGSFFFEWSNLVWPDKLSTMFVNCILRFLCGIFLAFILLFYYYSIQKLHPSTVASPLELGPRLGGRTGWRCLRIKKNA